MRMMRTTRPAWAITVTIMETRPLSKMKRWRLVRIDERAK